MKNLIMFIAVLFTFATDRLAYSLEHGTANQHFAKIKFGMWITEGRGKIGGTVISRNRGGAYTKNKVTPLNPNTSFQAAVRSRLTGLSQDWRALTEAQRVAWNAGVEQYARTDVFGDLRNPSGQQLFVRLNANILNGGGAQISDIPQAVGADPVTIGALIFAVGAGTHTVAFAATPVPADHALVVNATEQLSQGITNFQSKLRQVEVFAAAQATPADIAATYLAKFGQIVAGTKIGVEIFQIQILTGEVSGRTSGSTTVIA